ncbi:UNVERIFIED_CONTAM: hypothetical protein K2H54_015152 [Gekko kuhli]
MQEDLSILLKQKNIKFVAYSRIKKETWIVNGRKIVQVSPFRYLGVLFQSTRSWRCHKQLATQKAMTTMKAILCFFFFSNGAQYIPATIRVFNSVVISQLLYGDPIRR